MKKVNMKRAIGFTAATFAMFATVGFAGATQASADGGPATLGFMSTGPGVKCVQQMLNRNDHARLAEDSIYGPTTVGAVMNFQRSHNLVPDGIVGQNTGHVLQNAAGTDNLCSHHVPPYGLGRH